MVNENKIRILYVQPGKYPEERFVANEVHPLQRLVGGYTALRKSRTPRALRCTLRTGTSCFASCVPC